MLTGEVKQRLVAVLSELVARHQRARALVTEEVHNSMQSCALLYILKYIFPYAQMHPSISKKCRDTDNTGICA